MVCFKEDIMHVCNLMFPVLVMPPELRTLVLIYSGHLRLGTKTMSYTIFY